MVWIFLYVAQKWNEICDFDKNQKLKETYDINMRGRYVYGMIWHSVYSGLPNVVSELFAFSELYDKKIW